MSECESCGREFASDERVECQVADCPLLVAAPDDPTYLDGELSRDELLRAALAAREGETAASMEPTADISSELVEKLEADIESGRDFLAESAAAARDPKKRVPAERPKTSKKPKNLAPPPKAAKPPAARKKNVDATTEPDRAAPPSLDELEGRPKTGEKPTDEEPPRTGKKNALAALRSKLKERLKKKPQGADEADRIATDEDATIVDPEFNVDDVPIPESIDSEGTDDADESAELAPADVSSETPANESDELEEIEEIEAADIEIVSPGETIDEAPPEGTDVDETTDDGDGSAEDRTVEASRPDLDAIREAAAAAAREMAGDDDGFSANDTTAGQNLREKTPEKKRISVEFVSLTGEFEAADDDIVAMSDEFEIPQLDDVEMSQQVVVREPASSRQPPYQVVDFAGSSEITIEQTAEKLELRDVVDIDAWRDVFALVVGVVGCALVANFAAEGWWSPYGVLLGTFGVVVPTCAILGLLLLPSERRNEWVQSAARSGGIAGPFALLVTLAWASGDVRAWVLERTYEDKSDAALLAALEDPSDAVAGRACRVLARDQLNHSSVLTQLDERPQLARYCMDDISDKEHRIAGNRLSEMWRGRLLADDAQASTCDYADPYAQLPISEEQKFYDFFECAFQGADPALEKCCGETLRQTYGTGADLVPGIQLVAMSRLDPATMQTMLAPVIHRQRLDGARKQNAVALDFQDEGLQRAAFETSCLLLETEAAPVVIDNLSAYAADACQEKAAGATQRFDDWERVCTQLVGPRPTDLSTKGALCFAIDTLDIGKAVGEASIRVHAAIARHSSHALEEGIEVGSVQQQREEEASREERIEQELMENIDSRHDVHSKQASLDALERMEEARARHSAEADGAVRRWGSSRYKQARATRKNIMRILMKHDKSWKKKMKEDSGR